MPQPEVALHLGAAQVHVAVLQPHFLVLDGLFSRRERRQTRIVQHAQLGGLNLNFAGFHLGINSVLVAQANLAHGGHNVLGPHLLALGMAVGNKFLVENHLGNTCAVAQVKEDEIAVVAAAVHPAH